MMKYAALASSALAAIAQSASIPLVSVQPTYEAWCAQFGKCDGLTADRAAVFADNVEFMDAHNARFAAGTETYDVGVNEFSALTHVEFLAQFNLGKVDMRRNATDIVVLPAVHHLHGQADAVDWRAKGAVSKVKNQGQCGSCWSFSTTGSTEGRIAIASGAIPGGETGLSEQQLMDCSKAEGNQGCQGGLMDDAFKYIVKNGGLDSESDYPYEAKNGKCNKAKEAKDVGVIASFKDVTPDSEEQLAAAVAEGPVSVAIEADQRSFQSYKSGIMSGKCGVKLDHGVLAVGYGDGYWIVKNSWGETWGMKGYIQLERGAGVKAGQCGIAAQPSYPTVKKAALGLARPLAGPYEDPNGGGCSAGEEAVQITGLAGSFCSPKCSASSPCPANPSGSAKPQCVLETSGSQTPTQCALICDPSADTGACPGTATCKAIQSTGLCTYNN